VKLHSLRCVLPCLLPSFSGFQQREGNLRMVGILIVAEHFWQLVSLIPVTPAILYRYSLTFLRSVESCRTLYSFELSLNLTFSRQQQISFPRLFTANLGTRPGRSATGPRRSFFFLSMHRVWRKVSLPLSGGAKHLSFQITAWVKQLLAPRPLFLPQNRSAPLEQLRQRGSLPSARTRKKEKNQALFPLFLQAVIG